MSDLKDYVLLVVMWAMLTAAAVALHRAVSLGIAP